MTRALSWILVLAASTYALEAQDWGLESMVQRPSEALLASTAKALSIYEIRFDLELTNRSHRSIELPKSSGRVLDRTDAIVMGADVQLMDGTWKNLTAGSFYGDSKTKYDECTSSAPGALTKIGGLAATVPLTKSQATELGAEFTVRLHVNLYCKRSDDKIVYHSTTTTPFRVVLPVSFR